MDNNAHLKVEMVSNQEDVNEEEKRFNEIICYDSGDSGDGDSSNENEQSDVSNGFNENLIYVAMQVFNYHFKIGNCFFTVYFLFSFVTPKTNF